MGNSVNSFTVLRPYIRFLFGLAAIILFAVLLSGVIDSQTGLDKSEAISAANNYFNTYGTRLVVTEETRYYFGSSVTVYRIYPLYNHEFDSKKLIYVTVGE